MVINFAAGPAKLPEEVEQIQNNKFNLCAAAAAANNSVLEDVQRNMLNCNGSGISVMEMSHRSSTYGKIQKDAVNALRDLLSIPENYKVLLMQGGGTGQFAAVCMNLIGRGRSASADYAVTGSWSAKAAKEASQYGKVNLVLPSMCKYSSVPRLDTWTLDPNASYLYYCDNETVDGVEFDFVPVAPKDVPIVCDMSSNFLSRKIDVKRFGVIFAGAQKNIGPAGTTVIIIREDLLGHQTKETPSILNYALTDKNDSLLNTPNTFGIYVMGLVFQWIQRNGAIDGMQKKSHLKSELIYGVINKSNGFYYCPVDENVRSRMNVPFRIGGPQGDDNLEKAFLAKAESEGMIQLKGHRSVGGIRASLYNAITVEEAQKLADLMMKFYENNRK